MAEESTIEDALGDAIKEINKLIKMGVPDAEADRLRQVRSALFELQTAAIEKDLKENSKGYLAAIAGLKQATEQASAAVKDIEKVAAAIKKAVSAAKAVDKVVKLGIDTFT